VSSLHRVKITPKFPNELKSFICIDYIDGEFVTINIKKNGDVELKEYYKENIKKRPRGAKLDVYGQGTVLFPKYGV
jgi:hypothetical protein